MKLQPFKIGKVIIQPKTILHLALALFILGAGIGATAVLTNNSNYALYSCLIISLTIIIYSFFKKDN